MAAAPPPTTFPQKLHEIISDEANHDTIRWVNDGAAFKVLNSEAFEANIVRKHFRRKLSILCCDDIN